MSVLVIAEAGVNHNGSLELAKSLIDAAAEAGADFVKFQTFKAKSLVTNTAPKAEYQVKNAGADESQFEMIRSLELSEQMHEQLWDYCAKKNIGFLSTGFDISSIDYLKSLGIDLFKVPSGELTNLPFLRHIGALNKDVILSTGMACLGEIEQAIDAVEKAGTPRDKITVLHCTTEYPAPMEDVNLRAMHNIGAALGVRVGYSDHTPGIEVPIAAVALGATVIEKHFILDKAIGGPDASFSLDEKEFTEMVTAVRNAEKALGKESYELTDKQKKGKDFSRSLYVAEDIKKGELITEKNVRSVRPGFGMHPKELKNWIGKEAPKNWEKGDRFKH
jgi:N,N'-diacetyllegionaminate synthase